MAFLLSFFTVTVTVAVGLAVIVLLAAAVGAIWRRVSGDELKKIERKRELDQEANTRGFSLARLAQKYQQLHCLP